MKSAAPIHLVKPRRLPPAGFRMAAPGVAVDARPARIRAQVDAQQADNQAAQAIASQARDAALAARAAADQAVHDAQQAVARADALVAQAARDSTAAAEQLAGSAQRIDQAQTAAQQSAAAATDALAAARNALAAAERAAALAMSAKRAAVGIDLVKFEGDELVIVLSNGRVIRYNVRGEPGPRGISVGGPPGLNGQPGRGVSSASFSPDNGHLLLTLTDGSVIDAGAVPMPFDDYSGAEYLDDQISDGATVLTFTFAQAVQKVWVEFTTGTDTDTGRARADGGDPDSDTGTLLHEAQTQPITVTTSTVKVLVPHSGARVTVYGYRR